LGTGAIEPKKIRQVAIIAEFIYASSFFFIVICPQRSLFGGEMLDMLALAVSMGVAWNADDRAGQGRALHGHRPKGASRCRQSATAEQAPRRLSPAAAVSLCDRAAPRLSGLTHMLPSRGDLVKALAVALAYYVGAEVAFWIGTLSYFFAPLWPPNMILLCALLQAPYRRWWLYVLAAFPAHFAAEAEMGMEVMPLLGAFTCNVALALGAAAGLRRLSAGPPWLDTLAKARSFILVAAVGAPALVAGTVAAAGWISADRVGSVDFAMRWGIANVLGGIAFAPILITFVGEGLGWLKQIPPRRAAEAAVLVAALAITAYLGFPASAATFPVLACMPIPLMLWASVRFGPRGASLAILMVSVMALAGAIQGRAPFAASLPEHTVMSLQMFLAVLSAPFLVLAAVVVEGQEATAAASRAHGELEAILDNTPALIFVKDLEDRFIFANRAARDLVKREIVGRTAGELFPAETVARWSVEDEALISNGRPIVKEQESDLGAGRRVYLKTKIALRDSGGRIYAACVVASDITELKRAQHDVQDLSGRLIVAQDEERRRIARELHDGTVQTLAAVGLELGRLEEDTALRHDARATAREAAALVAEVQSELRTLSYLLHPPLLDEVGLAPALRWYVDGFTKRSGINVKALIAPDVGRSDAERETALFRIVQEALSNVHRHSSSKTAEIRLERRGEDLVLTISDAGRGIIDVPSGKGDAMRTLGVGIAGMRARLKQLGGTLEIRSGASGTTLIATLPQAGAKGGAPG
jgi:PAS domain S-box-containing protein